MKILIAGDSFSADWTIKYKNNGLGWPNMLALDHDVTNIAEAGTSLYKTYLQLQTVDINAYDAVIITHTSPNRIYVKEHPVHKGDLLHNNACLIHTDIKYHAESNPELEPIVDYFEKYYDLDYAVFVYNLIEEKIDRMFDSYNGKVIHMTNLPRTDLYQFDNMLDFSHLQGKKYHGLMNHYNDKANFIVYDKVTEKLKNS
jgi:hypothetical protein